jgi:hypothetical protein
LNSNKAEVLLDSRLDKVEKLATKQGETFGCFTNAFHSFVLNVIYDTDIMGFLALHRYSPTIMSDTPSQQTDLRPDESVSQINFHDDIPKANEDLFSNVGNETLSVRVLSGRGSSFTTSSQSAYFIVTEATLHEAQVFLKVLYYCPKILNLSHHILVSNSNFKDEAPIPNTGSITMSVSIAPLVSHIACASIVVKP